VERQQPRYTKASDGTNIAYLVLGEGPVDLVYAFGYQSNIDADGDVWFHARFRELLAQHFRLILFDRRGTGLSDRTGLEGPGALELGMDDLEAVMNAAGSERAILLGVSDGSLLCALFAASRPARTQGLVCWGLNARGKRSQDYPWSWTEVEWRSDIERVEAEWGTLAYAEKEMSTVAPSMPLDPTTTERVARMFRAVASPGSVVAMLRVIRDSDVRAALPAIQVPTLVMQSAGNPGLEEARSAAALIPGATFLEIATGDHLPFWEASEQVVDEIRRFAAKTRHEEEVLDRILATVLFTDIVDSTKRASELGDRAWGEVLDRHHAIVRAMLGRYRGKEIDTAGDGFFALFDGPARGVRCAEAIVDAVRPLGIEIRAGLHTGEVETDDDDVRGIAVHIGARVGAIAGPSQVMVSSTVRDLVAGSGLEFDDNGEYDLKGVPDRWRLYRVVDGADAVSH
jgi:class 3 adenylate cyclase